MDYSNIRKEKYIVQGYTVIDNEIVKTQYLNEIINLDAIHDNSKFHLTKYSNGSLVSIISYSIPLSITFFMISG